MSTIEVPVTIVGGSLVGLSAGLLLGRHGVRSLVVERHSGTAIHPRAAHATQRTMEIFRSAGLEASIRERSAAQFVQNGGVVEVATLTGGVTKQFIADLNAGIRDVSPCERVFLSQNSLEPLIMERARESGAEVRFSAEAMSIDEDSTGVTTLLRDRNSGATTTVRSPYLIAADGAHSAVRHRLGIGMHMSPRESCGRPGTRAPHLWLERQGRRLSSLDLYGHRFVLLAGPKADEWSRCARIASSEESVELDISRPGMDGLEDPGGGMSELYRIEPDGCVLVRPDGFISWRARNAEGASVARLRSVLSRCLLS